MFVICDLLIPNLVSNTLDFSLLNLISLACSSLILPPFPFKDSDIRFFISLVLFLPRLDSAALSESSGFLGMPDLFLEILYFVSSLRVTPVKTVAKKEDV